MWLIHEAGGGVGKGDGDPDRGESGPGQEHPDLRRGFPADGGPVLEARGLVKRYGRIRALDDASLVVERGRCLALVGESGSGKSTLLRAFNRMMEPDQGRVLVDGVDVAGEPAEKLRRRIGYVPQQGGLLPHWTVLRNVALVPRLRDMPDASERAARALARVGLDPADFAERWPRSLSGGQRQRVALARALAADPTVVLLDEPFGALDAITRADLQDEFQRLLGRASFTALLVTHDLREAFRLAGRVAVLRHGRIVRTATPDELRAEPGESYVARLLERAGVA
jgi:osmoprotectant transport system ATP-binding protein